MGNISRHSPSPKRVFCSACDGTGGFTTKSAKACSVCGGTGVEWVLPIVDVEKPRPVGSRTGSTGPR